jgi:3D (Asp-Asp-Asp) domain-containing protein
LPNPRNSALALLSLGALFLSACGTTQRALPPYEPPLARTDFQHVRTTAYTHTESDHREFSNRNALGGVLRTAGAPIRRAENVARAIPVSEGGAPLQPFSLEPGETRSLTTARTSRRYKPGRSAIYGSAAADWARWPAGTVFRLLSTGQVYRVDDYGWALAGRNTIDLYMANQRDMNAWGARQEPIQILQWGNSQESLRLLQSHQNYKHIKRMVLELEGRDRDAAELQ